ncbi:hypothetical protein A2774_00660 [Candidatus Roizmanbacteria bacterium RIFCSPHIGHO2_01_FULL_39_12c]|uniref:Uncharacterized protein n=1 Tax=Candidatus Roizmanbacteria bacterium RIFCSPHIGHO2_01_FULL_39_12c TaxID=1802031 RepID=A0A1F7GA25_9BACT|nr:MAG: hypothetical protein A2774_00660 [Candidatus Roizmanbacteria bacterium RIFCSPHIGHO2_01_FULL_39_12c]OGK47381.1 MAG: hypothetical protein A2963_04580 [Candidatus Roizmanbacteria bacterium RIFCSPLOWO2_01_FULL_40_13]
MTKKIILFFVFISLVVTALIVTQRNKTRVEPGMTQAKGRLVDGFPTFPQSSASTIENSYKKEDQGNMGYQAYYSTEQTPHEVMIWYKQKLISMGWTITDEAIDKMVNDLYLSAERNGEKVNVFSETEEGKTEITVEFPMQ